MEPSHHMAPIRELDLSAYSANSIAERINHAVPGLKSSTAFFTFLRANLVLPPSAMSSNVSTPLLEPSVSHSMPPPSPSPLNLAATGASSASTKGKGGSKKRKNNAAAASSNEESSSSNNNNNIIDDDDIPPLSLEVLTKQDDKVEALRLVADSIAQQRQQAARALVSHPLCLAGLAAALAAAYQFSWASRREPDAGVAILLVSGVIMTYLVGIRYFTSGYIHVAEDFKWDWLLSEDGTTEDTIIGTRYGDAIIGALVLRIEPRAPASPGSSSSSGGGGGRRRTGHGHAGGSGSSGTWGGRGIIRAWTTRLRYRGRGVGADMLHEAVHVTRERCGRDAQVGFAREHANSQMLLPSLFNGSFRRSEMRAARALENVLAQWEGSRRRR